jgi:hypothetical protein
MAARTHCHRFVFPTTDGATPLPERAVGVCRCGAKSEANLIWTQDDIYELFRSGPKLRKQMQLIAEDYHDVDN